MNQPYIFIYPPFLDFLPTQATIVNQVEFPGLYSIFSGVIYFIHSMNCLFPGLYSIFSCVIYFIHSMNCLYVSIPTSQYLPPHFPLNGFEDDWSEVCQMYLNWVCWKLFFPHDASWGILWAGEEQHRGTCYQHDSSIVMLTLIMK